MKWTLPGRGAWRVRWPSTGRRATKELPCLSRMAGGGVGVGDPQRAGQSVPLCSLPYAPVIGGPAYLTAGTKFCTGRLQGRYSVKGSEQTVCPCIMPPRRLDLVLRPPNRCPGAFCCRPAMVLTLTGRSRFQDLIRSHPLVVIDVTADWCPPSRMFAPIFARLESRFSSIKFAKIHGDEHEWFMFSQDVEAFPTFVFFNQGAEVQKLRVEGADERSVCRSLEVLASSKTPATASSLQPQASDIRPAQIIIDSLLSQKFGTPSKQRTASCPRGHNLQTDTSWRPVVCNECYKEGPRCRFGSCRPCDYDLCSDCSAKTLPRSAGPPASAPAPVPSPQRQAAPARVPSVHVCPVCFGQKSADSKVCDAHAASDPKSWSVAHLKQYIERYGLPLQHSVEKSDLVQLVIRDLGKTSDGAEFAAVAAAAARDRDPETWSVAQLKQTLSACAVDYSCCREKSDLTDLLRTKVLSTGDTNPASWSVRQLKTFLQAHGVDTSLYVDKGNIVQEVMKVIHEQIAKMFPDTTVTSSQGIPQTTKPVPDTTVTSSPNASSRTFGRQDDGSFGKFDFLPPGSKGAGKTNRDGFQFDPSQSGSTPFDFGRTPAPDGPKDGQSQSMDAGNGDELERMDSQALLTLCGELGIASSDETNDAIRAKLRLLLQGRRLKDGDALKEAKHRYTKERLELFYQELGFTEDAWRTQMVKRNMQRWDGAYSGMWGFLRRNFSPVSESPVDRTKTKLLIIAPGFGLMKRPEQLKCLTDAGYKCKSVFLHDPEDSTFDAEEHIKPLERELGAFRPTAVLCASKGGRYMVELWERGLWTGPSVMINAHPQCQAIPKGMNVVIAHGSGDKKFPRPRKDLYSLVQTPADDRPGKRFLYYAGNGNHNKQGPNADGHDMELLLRKDLLPRLVDAACSKYPEAAFMLSWHRFLSPERAAAEEKLGYHPDALQRFWVADPTPTVQRFTSDEPPEAPQYQTVPQGTNEYRDVQTIFLADSRTQSEGSHYRWSRSWASRARVQKIERVQNAGRHEQGSGGISLVRDQVGRRAYQAGAHVRWVFHGADDLAIDRIALGHSNFNPHMSGAKVGCLWGYGIYFARDAEYSAQYCGRGRTRRMLLCLLASGPPCQGEDGENSNSRPLRRPLQEYQCSVDCLSSPEIFVVWNSEYVTIAYVITFTLDDADDD